MTNLFSITKSYFNKNIQIKYVTFKKRFLTYKNLINFKKYFVTISYYNFQDNFKLNMIKGTIINIKPVRLVILTKDNIKISLPLQSPLLNIINIFKIKSF
uniref:Uncharacterized protein n=1 Tax=Nephromyces sp. ex Molgula occidentalis TaxID=2544991 RepID=A0A5C1H7W6_9APIC|nr:hypothetical protein [Nephromyces sp. ex Molgula occidentalis]